MNPSSTHPTARAADQLTAFARIKHLQSSLVEQRSKMEASASGHDPSSVYATFVGPIDQQNAKRIADGLAMATGQGLVQHIHIAFQSTGGVIGDGVFLYNLFRSFPSDLTLYNIGSVLSIAALSFLGAQKRKASASASFMFHRSAQSLSQPATASRAELLAHSLGMEDERTEALLRQHLNLTAAQWMIHERDDLWFSAADALAAGIIDEIVDFRPPMGQKLFTV